VDDQPLTLELLYAAIERQIGETLTGLEAVAAWPDIGAHVDLPALFLELAEIEPGSDPGTGEVALVCKFEARIIVGSEQPQHNQQAAQLATQLAMLLRTQSWDLDNVAPAEFVQAVPDWTKPELDGYTVWLVEWTQEIHLGEQQWPWPDNPPAQLVFDVEHELIELTPGVP
jgi:hypothetical protein